MDLTAQDVPLIFTDGSSAVEEKVESVAKYGIFHKDTLAIAAYVLDGFRQTNNAVELMAVLRALKVFTTGDIATCTDSQYVILGISGPAGGSMGLDRLLTAGLQRSALHLEGSLHLSFARVVWVT